MPGRSARLPARRGLRAAAIVLAAVALATTVPWWFAGRVLEDRIAPGFAGGAGPFAWSLVVARYDAGIYRSRFAATLRAGGASGIAIGLKGEAEHGLLTTRVVLHAEGLPAGLEVDVVHPPPWTAAQALDLRLALGAVAKGGLGNGWVLDTDPADGVLGCEADRCRARLAGARLGIADDAVAAELGDVTATATALLDPPRTLVVDAAAGAFELQYAGVRVMAEGLALEAAAGSDPARPPALALRVARAVHAGIPYVRLDGLELRAALEAAGETPAWHLLGGSDSNFGHLAWEGRIATRDGSLTLAADLPGGLVELVAGQLGASVDSLARDGWLRQDGARYHLRLGLGPGGLRPGGAAPAGRHE